MSLSPRGQSYGVVGLVTVLGAFGLVACPSSSPTPGAPEPDRSRRHRRDVPSGGFGFSARERLRTRFAAGRRRRHRCDGPPGLRTSRRGRDGQRNDRLGRLGLGDAHRSGDRLGSRYGRRRGCRSRDRHPRIGAGVALGPHLGHNERLLDRQLHSERRRHEGASRRRQPDHARLQPAGPPLPRRGQHDCVLDGSRLRDRDGSASRRRYTNHDRGGSDRRGRSRSDLRASTGATAKAHPWVR